MKKKWYICLSMTLALMVFLTAMNGLRRKEEALASRIAPKVLRFHVLANSDSPEDQALKLEVKDLLLDTIRQGLGSETAQGPEQDAGNPQPEGSGTEAGDSLTKDQTASYILEHKAFLEETAEAYMESRGFSYGAVPGKNLRGHDLPGGDLRRGPGAFRGRKGEKFLVRPLSLPLLCGQHPRRDAGGLQGPAEGPASRGRFFRPHAGQAPVRAPPSRA